MNKKTGRNWTLAIGVVLSIFIALTCYAAYNHNGDTDSINFRTVYPQAVGTKLDSCALCHKGGAISGTTYGSCQYCHALTNYGAITTQYINTLNAYGLDYYNHGRGAEAIAAIQNNDSDGDGYSNSVEIAALRYPGDSTDDPTKVAAPSKVYTLQQIQAMPQHTQFQLMNVTKNPSGDSYVEYSGVTMENLLNYTGMLPSASGIIVYAPDGFSYTHPLLPPASQNPANPQYYVLGPYPQGFFYYNAQADMRLNTTSGWCDYSAPSCLNHTYNTAITDDYRLLLAIKRDGQYLDPGYLAPPTYSLNGEGPFRVVPPQVLPVPGPPDQSKTSTYQNVVWPYNANWDHNAGASSRSVTIIKVNPLPSGTTDINILEAGWPYIDQNKIVIYGDINPLDNINDKLTQLIATVDAISQGSFKKPFGKWTLKTQLQTIQSIIAKGDYAWAYYNLQQNVLGNMHQCPNSSYPNDWLKDCTAQTNIYWAAYGVGVLLNILT